MSNLESMVDSEMTAQVAQSVCATVVFTNSTTFKWTGLQANVHSVHVIKLITGELWVQMSDNKLLLLLIIYSFIRHLTLLLLY